MPEASCPSDADLLSQADGGNFSRRLRDHLAACSGCQARLESIRFPAPSGSPCGGEDGVDLSELYYDRLCSRLVSLGGGAREEAGSEPLPQAIGKYRVITLLGKGGQASAYRAFDPDLRKDVVIKIGRRPLAAGSGVDEKLSREARLLSMLDDPRLARVHELGRHDGRPFLVLEHIEGRTLTRALKDESWPHRRSAALVASAARAAAAAHDRGIVHRDIKPDNIVLDARSGRPRLIDFGIAQIQDLWNRELDAAGTISGTFAFMAPEQARGETDRIGPRTDVFALGGVLYFLLTGKPPFDGGDRESAHARASRCDLDRGALRGRNIPAGLAGICEHALAAEPGQRHESAAALARDLEAFIRRPARLAAMASIAAAILLLTLGILLLPRFLGGPGGPAGRAEASLRLEIFRAGVPLRFLDALPLRAGDALSIEAVLPEGALSGGEESSPAGSAAPGSAGPRAAGSPPAGAPRIDLYWQDGEGKVHHLLPVKIIQRKGGAIAAIYPDPDQGFDAVNLEGAAGTETIILCASRGEAAGADKLEEILQAGRSWPELERRTAIHMRRETVEVIGPRGPGGGIWHPDDAYRRAMATQESLRRSCAWLEGWVFRFEG